MWCLFLAARNNRPQSRIRRVCFPYMCASVNDILHSAARLLVVHKSKDSAFVGHENDFEKKMSRSRNYSFDFFINSNLQITV